MNKLFCTKMTQEESEKKKKDVDIFRDTPIRYLGYANEVGESFRQFIGHRMVLMTYGISTMYVLADTCEKAWTVYNNEKSKKRNVRTCYTAMDTLIWQMLASVAIPGYTINRLCYFSNKALYNARLGCKFRRPLVTAIGLLAIPLIIHPIDCFTDLALDETIRKFAP